MRLLLAVWLFYSHCVSGRIWTLGAAAIRPISIQQKARRIFGSSFDPTLTSLESLRGGARGKKSKKDGRRQSQASVKKQTEHAVAKLYSLDVNGIIPSIDLKVLKGKSRYIRLIIEAWESTPPVTQLFIGSSLCLTLLAFILNGNNWPSILDINWTRIITRFELWRLLTGFMYLGSFGLNYLLTLHFLWTYMGDLEKLSAAKPEDFFVLLGFGGGILMLFYVVLGISPRYLGHNIATYLVYLWSRAHEGTSINMMDLFVVQAEMIPWFFCLQALVMDGEFPTADVIGIVVGHLYYFYAKKGALEPLKVLSSVIPETFRERYRKIVNANNENFDSIDSRS